MIDADLRYLAVERRGPIAIVSLDRPPVNAVNQAMYEEIRELFGQFDLLLGDAYAVVLRANGRHFSAGNDLEEFATLSPHNSPARMRVVRDAFAAIYDCPVPVVAAVQGIAAGTGLVLAAVCDLIVCGESAAFTTPEVEVGVMGGARHLRRLVPEQLMRRMYFSAERVPAAEIARFGGIDSVVPDAELTEAAIALCRSFTRHSPAALRHAKESLNRIESMELKSGYEAEQAVTARLVAHADSREARTAVLERRKPVYTADPDAETSR